MSASVDIAGLKEAPAPVEPRIAYQEPQLAGQQILALIRGKVFLASDKSGDVMPPGAPHVGLFKDDTRFLSRLELRVNDHEPIVLSSNTEGAYLSRIELTAKGSVPGQGLDIPVNTVYLHRQQLLQPEALYDTLQIHNFYEKPTPLRIELTFEADFMDIFQVRGMVRGKSGHYYEPQVEDGAVLFVYEGLDRRIRTTRLSFSPAPDQLGPNTATWNLKLDPHGAAHIVTTIVASVGDEQETGNTVSIESARPAATAAARNGHDSVRDSLHSVQRKYSDWKDSCTRFHSGNDIFDAMIQTTVSDFFALQIPRQHGTAIAAGVPWFVALFGRDSLIASLQTLILNPVLARGTLRVLATFQGTRQGEDNDEDPGKILHEFRTGEMTATGEIPFGRNYGSVDSTPLFLILMEQYYRWSGDRHFLLEMRAHVVAAVKWLLDYGDLDGDDLIEYCRRSSKGLFNQGWKDSGDAIIHADGRIAQPPVALVEVQGYAVRALRCAAGLLEMLGETELCQPSRDRAESIAQKIENQFWMDDRSYYAMALDRDKAQLRVLSSNPGHLFFAQAVRRERAQCLVDTLLSPDLSCGWGIRTLGANEQCFNPMSYHRGSVWPHDNSLIAYGMALYGFRKAPSQVAESLYDAALHFRDYRLPELFCGLTRRHRDEPVHYPVSCSPQAWASGAMLLMLTGLLGIRPDAGRRELHVVHPWLPPFLNRLRIDNLAVGASRVSLEFQRQGERTACSLLNIEGEELSVSVEFR